jgi:hypothetical protein
VWEQHNVNLLGKVEQAGKALKLKFAICFCCLVYFATVRSHGKKLYTAVRDGSKTDQVSCYKDGPAPSTYKNCCANIEDDLRAFSFSDLIRSFIFQRASYIDKPTTTAQFAGANATLPAKEADAFRGYN